MVAVLFSLVIAWTETFGVFFQDFNIVKLICITKALFTYNFSAILLAASLFVAGTSSNAQTAVQPIPSLVNEFWKSHFENAIMNQRRINASTAPFSKNQNHFPDWPEYYLAFNEIYFYESFPPITNPEVLGNYKSLRRLSLYSGQYQLDFLKGLQNLRHLNIDVSAARDLSPIGRLDRLGSLVLRSDSTIDFNQIGLLPKLHYLALDGDGFENL